MKATSDHSDHADNGNGNGVFAILVMGAEEVRLRVDVNRALGCIEVTARGPLGANSVILEPTNALALALHLIAGYNRLRRTPPPPDGAAGPFSSSF